MKQKCIKIWKYANMENIQVYMQRNINAKNEFVKKVYKYIYIYIFIYSYIHKYIYIYIYIHIFIY